MTPRSARVLAAVALATWAAGCDAGGGGGDTLLYVYFGCALAGSLLMGISLVGAHHGDAGDAGDVGDAGDGHFDGGDDADTHHLGVGHGAGGWALQFLSLRLWIYALMFGGLTGVLLRLVAERGEPLAGLLAAGVGIGAGALARAMIVRASSQGTQGIRTPRDLLGSSARVLVPFGEGRTGEVRLALQGSIVDVMAVSHEPGEFAQGTEVLVVDMRDGCAVVVRAEDSGEGDEYG